MTAITPKKILSKVLWTGYDYDPDATTATDIAWVDMRDAMGIAFKVFRTVGTSALTLLILVNTASDGSGDEATLKTWTPTAQPDAVADYIFAEALAEEIAQKASEDGYDYRYVSLSIAAATGTDECTVDYLKFPNRFSYDGLTSDSVAT